MGAGGSARRESPVVHKCFNTQGTLDTAAYKTRPPQFLGGVHKRDTHYSTRREPHYSSPCAYVSLAASSMGVALNA